jgi:hypothetical protein
MGRRDQLDALIQGYKTDFIHHIMVELNQREITLLGKVIDLLP